MLIGSQAGPERDLDALVTDAARGDEAAWRELVRRYSRRVFALAKSRCGRDDLAEEIAQSVFVTIAEQFALARADGAGYTERGRFESWLFRIAMNRLRDEVRRSRRQAEPVDPASFASLPDAAEPRPTDPGAEITLLRHAMSRLSDADREVIELRHHAGLAFKQIADLLQEPVGTLLARHHRALRKLRDLMSADEQDTAPSRKQA